MHLFVLTVTNLTKTKIDTSFLPKAARAAFAVLNWSDAQISLVLVGDKKIQELNKKYRHKNEATDVLSFEELNEIYICLPQAKKQARLDSTRLDSARLAIESKRARLLKTPLKSELTRLLVHGIVHLKGHNHERSKSEELEMQEIEKKILDKINKTKS